MSTDLFDNPLLQSFCDGFYGYGNYQGAYWFVGMEESGGGFHDIQNRLNAWNQMGRHELEDVVEYHAAFGVTHLFGERPRLQSTWNKLIRILLSAEGQPVFTEAVRQYQGKMLARKDGDSCLLELLPLPSPSTAHWLYKDHSSLPQLQDRGTYMNHSAPQRAAHIRERIQEHKPKAVVFYSMSHWYQHWWKLIAGVEFEYRDIGKDRISIGSNGQTVFVITKHPVTQGISNAYFHEAGRLIRES